MLVAPWAVPLLTAGIFILDVLAPLGTTVWLLYAVPLALAWFSPRERNPLYFSVVATVLVMVGFLASPPGVSPAIALFNRTLGVCLLWGFAMAMVRLRKARTGEERAERRLSSEQVERAHAEALMIAAQEARAYADTAVLGAAASRREAEEKLLASQLRLEGIIQSAMDAIITVDQDQKVVLFNHAAEQMFQIPAEKAIGESLDRFMPQRFRSSHREHVQAFGRSGATSRRMGSLGTITGLRADGTEFPIEAAISHVGEEGGQYFTVILRDITEREQLSVQLRRTERLAELGTLASGMAHEIGTPMNVIMGRAEHLMNRTTDEKTRKGLQIIVTQVERITRIMNQLLGLARRRPGERRASDLRKIIDDCLEVLEERLKKHRVRVEKHYHATVPPVIIDPDQMSQVMLNLILNADHAMSDGGMLRLVLSATRDHVTVTVADTGHGIPQDNLSKIFTPFFTTKEAGKGTGLGLTVVHGIIEEHKGTISVESEVGRGTTFTITLPVAGKG
jgi:PAS domain S-box-containing protein